MIGAPWSRAYGAEDDPLGAVSCVLFDPGAGMVSGSKVGGFFCSGTTVGKPLAATRGTTLLVQRRIYEISDTEA
jgi:hypothetical protein